MSHDEGCASVVNDPDGKKEDFVKKLNFAYIVIQRLVQYREKRLFEVESFRPKLCKRDTE